MYDEIPFSKIDEPNAKFYQLRFPKWSFIRPFSFMVFFGAIGIMSAGHIVLIAWGVLRAKGRKSTGQAPTLTRYGLYTTTISFVLAFVAVAYGWHGAGAKFTIDEVFKNSVSRPSEERPSDLSPLRDPTGHLASLDAFTWNCALYDASWYGLDYIADFLFIRAVFMCIWCHKGKRAKAHSRCPRYKSEQCTWLMEPRTIAQIIRALTIPILFLCASMLGIEMRNVHLSRKVSEIQADFIKMPDEPPGEGDLVPLQGLAAPNQVWRRGGPGYPEGRDPEIIGR